MFADYGVHPSLDIYYQHQVIFGNLNMSLPSPPPYKRTVWHYSKANAQSIRFSINNVDWVNSLNPLTPSEMVEHFTTILYAIMSLYIPNETTGADPGFLLRGAETKRGGLGAKPPENFLGCHALYFAGNDDHSLLTPF